MNDPWVEIKNEKGQVYYFNKLTGITQQDKPGTTKPRGQSKPAPSMSSSYDSGAASKQIGGSGFTSQAPAGGIRPPPSIRPPPPVPGREGELKDLLDSRNLSLPKTIQEQAYSSKQGEGAQSSDKDAYMDSLMSKSLISEAPARDVYPTLNYFRTEDNIEETKKRYSQLYLKRNLSIFSFCNQIRTLQQIENLSKEEAIIVFKEALQDAGVTSTWRWDDAQRVTGSDIRIKALKTIGERKTVFNQFIEDQKARERNEARTRRQIQREGFTQLLEDSKKYLNGLSKFYSVARMLGGDSRFRNIDEKDREEIFQDYIDELLNKEREDQRVKYEQQIEELKMHFGEVGIPVSAKWLEVEKQLKESKDPLFTKTEPLEQITAFEDYIKGLERLEFQQKKLEKRRLERKNRDAFEQLVKDKLLTREVTHTTKWSDFVKAHRDHPGYVNLQILI